VMSMSRQHIIKRLLYLRNWEFANIFFLPLCLYLSLTTLKVEHWQPYALSCVFVCVIFAQGTLYWHLKLQTIYKNTLALPPYFYRTFSTFNQGNIIMLLSYPVLMLLNPTTALITFQTSVWSHALFLFAILEYINYYHYQLSHDNMNDIRFLLRHKKIRRAPLYVDLHRGNNPGTISTALHTSPPE